ncbi:LCP family protein [Globicatella sulfidifaciens]|uniref:Transcriptional attenuator, LytR family n=1 Tax=Globicatella sulfidifaciens DSM 15739 TaxID=1121925 RepID=A0A1T4NRT5_9LACT|nr:LCP family protein [Globicatella sulfidifaciens]SJZ81914.1 transcriptional attenuator, LytR family [Globicatella sulfidifaciens DSM 15739]
MNKRLINLLVVLICIVSLNNQTVYATETQEPMSVLLLGIDSGSLGRTEVGRSDVMMVMTLNPNTNHITLTSIPRDTYVEIVGQGMMDKINHAYAFGGIEMSRATVEQFLGIPIDHYILVNMAGLSELIDQVDGVEVIPPSTFSISGYHFVEGQAITLDGEMALAYVRERYTSGGDYGRQERQRQLVTAVIHQISNNKNIFNLKNIFYSLNENIKTDFDLITLMGLYKEFNDSVDNVTTYQISGYPQMIENIYYEVPDAEVLEDVKYAIQNELNEQ